MRFEYVFISLMVAVMFITGGLYIINNEMNQYNVTIENEIFEDVVNVSDDINDRAITQKDNLLQDEIPEDDAETGLFRAGITTVKNFWGYFTSIGKLISALASALHIPPFITNTFMVMLMFSAIFGVVYLIFRFQPRS